MKKQLYLLGLLWSCAYLLPLNALADSTCTADYTYHAIGRTVQFKSAPGLPAGTTHWWTFGDATNSSDVHPIHTFATAGTYWVTHYIYNANANCKDSIVKAITVTDTIPCNSQPKFSWKRDTANCLKVYFFNETLLTTNAAHFIWKFGDGTTSNALNPTHTYAQQGVYTVCLVIETSNGCRKEICQTVEVRCNTACNLEVKFDYRKDTLNPLKIYFLNHTLVPTAAAQYLWTFGDGTSSTERNPIHVYQAPGTYEVCLKVIISNTCFEKVCKLVTIQAPQCDVRAKFEWKRDASQWNKLWFNNLSHPIQNIWRTSWTYGDGTSSQDFNSFHVYQQPGKYYVCLKVQSLSGCIDTYCDSVIVRKPDSCDNKSDFRFEVNPNNLLEYHFKPKAGHQAWKYFWNFGDGTSSTSITPIHKFAQPGVYKVCLTVQTTSTCRTTTCKEIRVGLNCDEVKVKFEYKRDSTKPYIVKFRAIGNMPIIKQRWIIRKDSNGTFPAPLPVIIEANNPTYSFKDSGWYVVCLQAVTSNNCQKTYCERIYIARGENGRVTTSSLIPVYPNPASNLVRLEVQVETSTMLQMRVLDGTGSAKMQFTAPAMPGNNLITIPVEKLSNGMYMVEIRYGNQVKLAKFQKS
jgi:PKD repeat protein